LLAHVEPERRVLVGLRMCRDGVAQRMHNAESTPTENLDSNVMSMFPREAMRVTSGELDTAPRPVVRAGRATW
jgi:hypothetical protein